MKKTHILIGLLSLFPMLASAENPRIAELTRQKQEKMERLQKCEGTTKVLKIAGLSTIGLTAVGVVGNVVESQKLQEYKNKNIAAQGQITKIKKEIEEEKAKAAAVAVAAPKPTASVTPAAKPADAGAGTVGDTVCGVKCDDTYKDKTVVCKVESAYKSYKCAGGKWSADTVQTCNERMIADSTYTRKDKFDNTANTYLFTLPDKNNINGVDAYLGQDVCYACERGYVFKDSGCIKSKYALPCDSNAKASDSCTFAKHAKAATCKSIGDVSNTKAVLTCVATNGQCETDYEWYQGICKKTTSASSTATQSGGVQANASETTTATTASFASVDISVDGNSYMSWDFSDEKCYNGDSVNCEQDITARGQWKANFSYGTVYGLASCNGTAGVAGAWDEYKYTLKDGNKKSANSMQSKIPNTADTSDEKYCWCMATGYTPSGGSKQQLSSLSWVFYNGDDDGSAANCAKNCATNCANRVQIRSSFRAAMFK